jgi:hypothetical protein
MKIKILVGSKRLTYKVKQIYDGYELKQLEQVFECTLHKLGVEDLTTQLESVTSEKFKLGI